MTHKHEIEDSRLEIIILVTNYDFDSVWQMDFDDRDFIRLTHNHDVGF